MCGHRILAPAKLNLRLKVVGRRSDGYHLLSMLNVSTSLCDELFITLHSDPGVALVVQPAKALTEGSTVNSMVRAWEEFWQEFSPDGAPHGVSIALTKCIPIGAGLGGGSSDAGAMLRFLVAQCGQEVCRRGHLTPEDFDARVMQVALRVGADVPYAYCGGLCWVTGVGEQVQALHGLESWGAEVLISMPAVTVPTADFYRFFREQRPQVVPTRDMSLEQVASEGLTEHALVGLIENDFEGDIVRFRPAVGEALRLARQFFPDTTSVTGSGAAIFSLVPEGQAALIGACQSCLESNGLAVHRARLLVAAAARGSSVL